jgi:hypothetical protein
MSRASVRFNFFGFENSREIARTRIRKYSGIHDGFFDWSRSAAVALM